MSSRDCGRFISEALQVNDFNLFGRTYKVMLQAEQDFRKSPESINDIYLRSGDNTMVPMSTVSTIGMTTGPDILQRYNMFRTAEINGANGPGISTGQALEIVEDLASKDLPHGYGYEWTGIAYQEKQAGGTQGPIFGMAMVFVFLVLAAQYESWAVPFSVLLQGCRSASSARFWESVSSVLKTTSTFRSESLR